MEDRERMEGREERDVIGRKKGPVLASVILAVILIIFTRGKGFNLGRSEEKESGVTLEEVLSDPDAYAGTLPERAEILVDGDQVSVNGWLCGGGEELKDFLAAFAGDGRQYEIRSDRADPDTLQWVRDAFASLSLPYTETAEAQGGQ